MLPLAGLASPAVGDEEASRPKLIDFRGSNQPSGSNPASPGSMSGAASPSKERASSDRLIGVLGERRAVDRYISSIVTSLNGLGLSGNAVGEVLRRIRMESNRYIAYYWLLSGYPLRYITKTCTGYVHLS